jgi:hypothetical protein
LNHAIISSFLDDLAVQASDAKDSPDNLPIELESVRSDQGEITSRRPSAKLSKQGERVAIAASADNCRRPEARPDFDGSEDPDRRMPIATNHSSDLVHLQFADWDLRDFLLVESATGGGGFLQPAIYRVPGNLLDSGNRGFIHALDAESSDFIEGNSSMLEAVIDGSLVPAEGPAAHLAPEPTAAAPAGRVESKTNNHSQRGFCSQRALSIWTAESLHGAWTRSSVELVTSRIGLKPYHMNGLQEP